MQAVEADRRVAVLSEFWEHGRKAGLIPDAFQLELNAVKNSSGVEITGVLGVAKHRGKFVGIVGVDVEPVNRTTRADSRRGLHCQRILPLTPVKGTKAKRAIKARQMFVRMI